jgi:SAM-dependent methyltransferase
MSDTEAGYDLVAEEYAAQYANELDRKPFDREMLDRFAAAMRGRGQVCELGSGPGQIARYLKDRGVDVYGMDLSAEMVRLANTLHPDIPFRRGDMRSPDVPPGSQAGIVAFYSIIHLRREDVPHALSIWHAALQPGGRLLLAFHGGEGTLHRDLWFDKPVSIDVTMFSAEEMSRYLESAGFVVDEVVERPPYEFEYQTSRLYVSATR